MAGCPEAGQTGSTSAPAASRFAQAWTSSPIRSRRSRTCATSAAAARFAEARRMGEGRGGHRLPLGLAVQPQQKRCSRLAHFPADPVEVEAVAARRILLLAAPDHVHPHIILERVPRALQDLGRDLGPAGRQVGVEPAPVGGGLGAEGQRVAGGPARDLVDRAADLQTREGGGACGGLFGLRLGQHRLGLALRLAGQHRLPLGGQDGMTVIQLDQARDLQARALGEGGRLARRQPQDARERVRGRPPVIFAERVDEGEHPLRHGPGQRRLGEGRGRGDSLGHGVLRLGCSAR